MKNSLRTSLYNIIGQDYIRNILPEDKKLFSERSEIEECVTDPVFLRLLYHQLVHDYRSGNYSVLSKADVEKSALLILEEIGYDAHAPLRRFSKPFYTHRGYNPGNQLLRDIETTYLSLKNLTEDDAKREFIGILSELSYGKSVFYNVEKIDNPADLQDRKKSDVILALKKSGVHYSDLEPRRLLHSTHFKDIKHIGSSSTALILERRADILRFRTDRV
ncbi:kinesin-like protein KIN-14E isoform X1 [Tanacetum coccineum]